MLLQVCLTCMRVAQVEVQVMSTPLMARPATTPPLLRPAREAKKKMPSCGQQTHATEAADM
jgi:hypothetical protein